MSENVRHQGTVLAVEGTRVSVRIVQMAACAGCQVASQCHVHDMKEKVVEAECNGPTLPQVGDSVAVVASAATARRSLLLAFGYPLLLMLCVLVCMTLGRQDEDITALVMLGVLIPYYIILWFMRDRIRQKLSFWIEN